MQFIVYKNELLSPSVAFFHTYSWVFNTRGLNPYCWIFHTRMCLETQISSKTFEDEIFCIT